MQVEFSGALLLVMIPLRPKISYIAVDRVG